jgi:2-C-methyl-D-erythritol 4-phosphate cytidylyltransferase
MSDSVTSTGDPRVAVILPAAGVGRRFQAAGTSLTGRSKLEEDIAGRPVFLRTVERFLDHPRVVGVWLAVNPDARDEFAARWGDQLGFRGVRIVEGGRRERWETVMLALRAIDADADAHRATHVAVHDAARPLVSRELIDRTFEAAFRCGAAIPATPIRGTIKRTVERDADVIDDRSAEEARVDDILGDASQSDPAAAPVATTSSVARRSIVETVDRTDLYEAQTPQVFAIDLLRRANAPLKDGVPDGFHVTDDASLVERLGETVEVVEGEATNLKITHPADLDLARMIVQASAPAPGGSGRKFARDEDDLF